jgi:uncharacterized MAPEG superfamily protein
MTLATWCVVLAGLLPYGATAIAKLNRRDYDNAHPRAWLARQEGFRARANAAQLNGFEAFPLFAAAVAFAHWRQAPTATMTALCVAFVVLRTLYTALYVANLPSLRSAAWFGGFGCALSLFFIG